MTYFKTFESNGRIKKVEAEGELYEVNGISYALEIPKDEKECNCYELTGNCSKCTFRYKYRCNRSKFIATEITTGLLVASAKSKSALKRIINKYTYEDMKEAISSFLNAHADKFEGIEAEGIEVE